MVTALLTAYAAWIGITATTVWLASFLYRAVRNTIEAGRENETDAVVFVLPEPPSTPPTFAKAS